MALERWALPQLSQLLPLDEGELKQILAYTNTLSDTETAEHLRGMLGDSPEATNFISSYNEQRAEMAARSSKIQDEEKRSAALPDPTYGQSSTSNGASEKAGARDPPPDYAPPPGPPPTASSNGPSERPDVKGSRPSYAAPSGPPPASAGGSAVARRNHTNPVIEAGTIRARDEQEMQQLLQNLQFQYNIYNSDIEPEHETDYPCSCPIHQYQRRKWSRYGVQEMWSKAVMYPGEKSYNDNKLSPGGGIFSSNPYRFRVISPYGYQAQWRFGPSQPIPGCMFHTLSVSRMIHVLTHNFTRSCSVSTADDPDEQQSQPRGARRYR